MKLRKLAATIGLISTGSVALLSSPAHAFSFQANYTQVSSGDVTKGDIFLDSVTLESGKVVSDFTLINSARIVSNDIYTGGNSGAASADIGDEATTGLSQEALTNEGAKAVMNNLNLNNIIDTENKGKFILDLQFEQAVDNIFLFERGMNSRMDVQALDANGNAIGNLLQLSKSNEWDYAGFKINTKEIGGAQKVGSIGISLTDLGVNTNTISALRVSSEGAAYRGPDFKVVGSVAQVPEPSTLLGLGAVVAGLLSAGRRKQEENA